MKIVTFFICFILSSAIILHAQIPNASFENWSNGSPDGWATNNFAQINMYTVVQSSDAESGASAAKIQVASYLGSNAAPILTVGTAAGRGIPVSEKYMSLKGYYKFNPLQNDQLLIIVTMRKNGSLVGTGDLNVQNGASSYTPFSVNITYSGNQIPDSCQIYFSLAAQNSDSVAHSGTYALIDNLSFSTLTSTAVSEKKKMPEGFKLFQNYPNPFNPTTTIEYQIPKQSFVKLNIYDVIGNKIAQLVNKEEPVGNYHVNFNASNLSSGVYFYKLEAGNYVQIKKLILMK